MRAGRADVVVERRRQGERLLHQGPGLQVVLEDRDHPARGEEAHPVERLRRRRGGRDQGESLVGHLGRLREPLVERQAPRVGRQRGAQRGPRLRSQGPHGALPFVERLVASAGLEVGGGQERQRPRGRAILAQRPELRQRLLQRRHRLLVAPRSSQPQAAGLAQHLRPLGPGSVLRPEREGLLEVGDRLLHRAELERAPGRLLREGDGPPAVAGGERVPRELGGRDRHALPGQGLAHLQDTGVAEPAPGGETLLREGLAHQRMAEREPVSGGVRRVLGHEPRGDAALEPGQRLSLGQVGDGAQEPCIEALADHRPPPEQLAGVLVESPRPRPDRFGEGERQGERRARVGLGIVEPAGVRGGAGELLEGEGAAARQPHDLGLDRHRWPAPQDLEEHVRRLAGGQRLEGDLLREPGPAQLAAHLLQGGRGRRVVRPVRHEHDRAGRRQRTGEERHEPEAGGIRPVEVLQDQQEPAPRREPPQVEGRALEDRPEALGREGAAAELGQDRGRKAGGDRVRVARSEARPPRRADGVAEDAERLGELQHRPALDDHPPTGHRLLGRPAREPGLAHARFAHQRQGAARRRRVEGGGERRERVVTAVNRPGEEARGGSGGAGHAAKDGSAGAPPRRRIRRPRAPGRARSARFGDSQRSISSTGIPIRSA